MPRRILKKNPKKAIYVFWEGESEEVYTKLLKPFIEVIRSLEKTCPNTMKSGFSSIRN